MQILIQWQFYRWLLPVKMPVVAVLSLQSVPQNSYLDMMTSGKDKSLNEATDSDYRAFLIRCWREGNSWRFTLETIGQTRQKVYGFAGYEPLANYLEQFFYIDGNPNGSQADGPRRK